MGKTNAESSPLPSLAVLISGRGSNMLAIADACERGELPAQIGLVLSNRPDAKGLEHAQEKGLTTDVIDHKAYANRQLFDQAVHERLYQMQPRWIVLAGFMRILTAEFVNQWEGKILNIHPSLLPKYPGLDTHKKAIESGDSEAGASVHIVTPELDAGPVIAQIRVPVLDDDTAETLGKRVLAREHQLFVDALKICLRRDSAGR
ncbi:MAG: phosphoribosylglycinamide formyltransferase [Granulosicoccus sp.]